MLRRTFRPLLFSAYALFYACKPPEVMPSANRQYEMNATNVPVIDSAIYRSVDIYRKQMQSQMSEVLVQSDMVLDKGSPESTLGNYVADVCLSWGNSAAAKSNILPADFILLNSGGLRKAMPAGSITLGDFYELMPFENQLVILDLSGKQVSELLDNVASKGGAPVSGIRFQIKRNSKMALNITVKGNPLDTTASYRIMTTDYMANGGDQFIVLTKAFRRQDVGLKLRDALIDDARQKGHQGGSLHAQTDNRISYVD